MTAVPWLFQTQCCVDASASAEVELLLLFRLELQPLAAGRWTPVVRTED